jgi:hypothetical protein
LYHFGLDILEELQLVESQDFLGPKPDHSNQHFDKEFFAIKKEHLENVKS